MPPHSAYTLGAYSQMGYSGFDSMRGLGSRYGGGGGYRYGK